MNASELRLGNWIGVYASESQVNEIDSGMIFFNVLKNLDGTNFEYDYIDTEFAEPIPLTSEWMVKFGFEPVPSEGQDAVFFFIDDSEISIGFYSGGTIRVEFNEVEIKGILYVHQFQNLYFALTHRELTIKNH